MQAQAAYHDFSALAGLRLEARRDGVDAIGEVAGQFEALFVQMMVKAMRDATPRSGLFGSHQMQAYEQMYDQQLSLELSRQGGIGLAEVIERQFAAPSAAPGADVSDPLRPLPPRMAALPEAVTVPAAATSARPDWSADSPEANLDTLAPHADRAARQLGVEPGILLAQAALETGWGRQVLGGSGGSSNNLFNIKEGSGWQGPTVARASLEYRDGVAMREVSAFRAYPSAAAAFDDYVALIGGSPRYSAAVGAGEDSGRYIRELQRSGYATDPAYADKVLAVRAEIDRLVEAAPLKLSALRSL